MLFVCLSFWKLYFKALCSLEKYTYRLEGIDKRLKKSWTSLGFFLLCFDDDHHVLSGSCEQKLCLWFEKSDFRMWDTGKHELLFYYHLRHTGDWKSLALGMDACRCQGERWRGDVASERVAGLSVGRIHQLLKDRISFICCKFSCGF